VRRIRDLSGRTTEAVETADQVGRLLNRFPNLMCDLGHMFNGPNTKGGYGKYWPRKTPWIHLVQDDDGKIVS